MKQALKVVFDHQIFAWQQYGGISRYSTELAYQLLVNLRQKAHIFSPFFINSYLNRSKKNLSVFGFKVPKIPMGGRIYRALNSILFTPYIFAIRPDIVHETYYSAWQPVLFLRRHHKTVITVHDMIHEKYPESFSPLDPTRYEKARAVKRADHVICVSENTRKDLIALLNVSPEKVTVVHNGFSRPKLNENKFDYPRSFILYVGQRGGYKNFDRLFEAYASSWLSEKYDLLCFGGGELNENEKRMASMLGVNLKQIKQISGDDDLLSSIYASATAFVYPSLYEGFGIPPLEAMSLGCPVVCSSSSSIPEVVGDAAQMFEASDVNSIKESLERVIGDDSLRNSLIERGLERAKLFSWERCARETLSVYEKVLS